MGIWESIWAFGIAAAVFGTLEFFLFFGGLILFSLVTRLKSESYWATGIVFVLAFAYLTYSGGVHPLIYIKENPFSFAFWIIGYIGMGLFWTCCRWVKYLTEVKRIRDKITNKFIKGIDELIKLSISQFNSENKGGSKSRANFNDSTIQPSRSPWEDIKADEKESWITTTMATSYAPAKPKLLTEAFGDRLARLSYEKIDDVGTATSPPTWKDHKKDYGAYFFYWPFDIPIYFLSEFLFDLWRAISNKMQAFMDMLSRKFVGGPVKVGDED